MVTIETHVAADAYAHTCKEGTCSNPGIPTSHSQSENASEEESSVESKATANDVRRNSPE